MPPSRNNRYFLDGEGIAREVVTADICRYLGNDALVKPGAFEGRDGYWVTAYRALTSNMIADLKADTSRWHAEKRDAGSRGASQVSYYQSQVHEDRQMSGPTPANAYSTSGSNPPYSYEDSRTPTSQPQQVSYDPAYSMQPQYGQGSFQVPPQAFPSEYAPSQVEQQAHQQAQQQQQHQQQPQYQPPFYSHAVNYSSAPPTGPQSRSASTYEYAPHQIPEGYPSPVENPGYSQPPPPQRNPGRGGHPSQSHGRGDHTGRGGYYR